MKRTSGDMTYTYAIKPAGSLNVGEAITRDYEWHFITDVEIDPNMAVVVELPPLITLEIGLGQGDYVAISIDTGMKIVYKKTKPIQYRTGTP